MKQKTNGQEFDSDPLLLTEDCDRAVNFEVCQAHKENLPGPANACFTSRTSLSTVEAKGKQ